MRNLIFLGTKKFAADILKKIEKKNLKINYVFTKIDKKIGRGQQSQAHPVKKTSTYHQIPTYTCQTINSKLFIKIIKMIQPDIIIMTEYGEKINREIINIPKYGIINIHPSILPELRGPTPIEHTIILGKKKTGVSIIKINEKIDTGVILNTSICKVKKNETYTSLSKKLVNIASNLLIETLEKIDNKTIKKKKQQSKFKITTLKLDKSFYQINWSDTAANINRKIRATFDIKKHYTKINDMEIKIIKTTVIKKNVISLPGKIINIKKHGIDVTTRNKILRIKEIQIPGKNINSIKNILNSKKYLFKIGYVFKQDGEINESLRNNGTSSPRSK